MNKTCKSFIIFFVLFGCGPNNNNPAELEEVTLGAELQASQLIEGSAKATALRICYAYQSKNTSFRSSYLNTNFNFKMNYENCSGDKLAANSVLVTTLSQTLQSAPMVYDSTSTLPYLNKVETHQHGQLSEFCQQILRGDDMQSIVSLNSEQKREFRFGTGEAPDHYSISIANKTINELNQTVFAIAEEHRYFVNTSGTAAANRKGVVYEYSFKKGCASDEVEENLSQELME